MSVKQKLGSGGEAEVIHAIQPCAQIGFSLSATLKFRAVHIGGAAKIAKVTVIQVLKKFPGAGDGELWIETMVTHLQKFLTPPTSTWLDRLALCGSREGAPRKCSTDVDSAQGSL